MEVVYKGGGVGDYKVVGYEEKASKGCVKVCPRIFFSPNYL